MTTELEQIKESRKATADLPAIRNSRFRCTDCGGWPDDYMLTAEAWALTGLGPKGGFLCLNCLPARMPRPLTADDFPPIVPNAGIFFGLKLAGQQ